VMFRTARDAPFHMQWDDDSRLPAPDPGSGPDNCGPASVENIAHFYVESHLGIFRTRRLAVTHDGPTVAADQRLMLSRRGVPCFVTRPSLAAIKSFIADGRRPIILGLNMAAVPREPHDIAGHPFRKLHAVVALENAMRSGVSGVLIRDPNFSKRTGRLDPTGGARFYPDSVIQTAAVDARMSAIVPEKPKSGTANSREMPMLKYKAEAWRTVPGGTPLFDGIDGPKVARLGGGVGVTTIGESRDEKWRYVLATVNGVDKWFAARRDDLDPMVQGGNPAFNAAIRAHLVSREP